MMSRIVNGLTFSSLLSGVISGGLGDGEVHCTGLCQRSHPPNDIPVMVKMEAMEKKINFWNQAKLVSFLFIFQLFYFLISHSFFLSINRIIK